MESLEKRFGSVEEIDKSIRPLLKYIWKRSLKTLTSCSGVLRDHTEMKHRRYLTIIIGSTNEKAIDLYNKIESNHISTMQRYSDNSSVILPQLDFTIYEEHYYITIDLLDQISEQNIEFIRQWIKNYDLEIDHVIDSVLLINTKIPLDTEVIELCKKIDAEINIYKKIEAELRIFDEFLVLELRGNPNLKKKNKEYEYFDKYVKYLIDLFGNEILKIC